MIQQRLTRSLQTLARQHRQCLRIQHPSSSFSTSSPILRSFAATPSQSPSQRRTYASAQPAVDPAKQGEPPSEGASKAQLAAEEATKTPAPETDASAKELEAAKKEVIDITDRYKRQVAEYRNLQEQTRREVQAGKDFALQRFSRDLLESIDNLDRALTIVPAERLTADGGEANKDLRDLHSGLKMTEKILMDTLKKHGLERFDPSEGGDKFDPNKHEAVFQAPQPGKEEGVVFHTQSKGFLLNGRVIRVS